MVIKSLSITEDAYEALKALKCGDESFSDAILRLSREKVGAATKFFGIWRAKPATAASLERHLEKYRREFDRESSERQKRFFGKAQRR